MSLGLEDRSARLLSGRDVWTEIKALLYGYNDVQAAIAFVGADADQYLPLRGPATIVVNAGEEALRNGWTDPAVLLRWTRRGVRVHTLSTLHAKLLVAQGTQPFVLVGSADVLSTSGKALEEAILVADEKDTVDEVRSAIDRWRRLAGEPLTDAWLQAAALRYRPPGGVPAGTVIPSPVVDRPAVQQTSAARVPVAAPDLGSRFAAQPAVAAPVRSAPAPAPAAINAPAPAPELSAAVGPDGSAAPDRSAVPTGGPAVSEPSVMDASESGPPPAAAPHTLIEAVPPAAPEPATAADAPSPTVLTAPEPLTAPAAVTDDDLESAPEVSAAAVAEPLMPVIWPRPKFIYLATLTRDGLASAAAQEQLEALRADHRVPSDSGAAPLLDVEMFWWDAATRSAAKSTTYREGWHVVPISVPASGRPAVLSPVHSPGRVLQTLTEYAGGPARTYYYLLIHQQGVATTFRKLREALTAVGEKPSYDHAYMMQHKVEAILDLWPTIHYTG